MNDTRQPDDALNPYRPPEAVADYRPKWTFVVANIIITPPIIGVLVSMFCALPLVGLIYRWMPLRTLPLILVVVYVGHFVALAWAARNANKWIE